MKFREIIDCSGVKRLINIDKIIYISDASERRRIIMQDEIEFFVTIPYEDLCKLVQDK